MPGIDDILRELPNLVNGTCQPGHTRLSDIESYEDTTVTGTVLYPLSAADVVAPLSMFPNAKRYVFVDGHSFADASVTTVDNLFNTPYLRRLGRINDNDLKITAKSIPYNLGYFGENKGYDITGIYQFIRNKMDISYPGNINEMGLSHLILARLRLHCGATILSITQAPESNGHAICIRFERNSSHNEQEIIFVTSTLGTNDEGYQWLYQKNYSFERLFIKGFPHGRDNIEHKREEKTRLMCAEILTLIRRNSGIESSLRVITDLPQYRYEKNILLKKNASPLSQIEIEGTFGYHNEIYTYMPSELDFDMYSVPVITDNDTPDVSQYPISSALKDIHDKILEEENKKAQANQDHENAVDNFRNSTPENKLQTMISANIAQIQGDTIYFYARESFGNPFRIPYIEENIFAQLIDATADRGICNIIVKIDIAQVSLTHEKIPELIINNLKTHGKHITSLIIEVSNSCKINYTNHYAIKAASALQENGIYLNAFYVQSNTKAAKRFAEAVMHLAQHHALKNFNISPITQWTHPITEVVSSNQISEPKVMSQSSNSQGTTKLSTIQYTSSDPAETKSYIPNYTNRNQLKN